MGTQKSLMIKTHFDYIDKGFLEEFVSRAMPRLAKSFWVLVSKCFFQLFGIISRYLLRLDSDDNSQKNDTNCRADHSQQDDQIASVREAEEENHEFVFGFRFQNCGTGDSVFQESSLNQNTSKYQVISRKDFSGVMEEPETMSFSVQELFVGANDPAVANNGNQDLEKFNPKQEDPVVLEKTEDFVQNQCRENIREIPEQGISSDCDFPGNKDIAGVENNHSGLNNFSDEVELLSEDRFRCLDSKLKFRTSISSKGTDSATYDFFANSVYEEIENSKLEFTEKIPNSDEISIGDTDDECTELDPNFPSLDQNFPGKVSGKENLQCRETEQLDSPGKFEEPSTQKKSWDSDPEDDDDEFDILLQHQELVEQMKVEMKNAKSKGSLPTILEESETPKMAEDLEPMRIDEKFQLKDRLEEIQKVYKGYSEKMRKLDVLNYQTLHAISFLQLKDQIHQSSSQKSSLSAIKSLLQIKLRRIYADPTLKSITDLQRNLEMVCVGQTCLSWEILHWQHGKAKELMGNDPEGNCNSYNQVAGEFQQFQVLVQRFVENEPFQGPRVQNYAKNRCDIRTLLQVPAIKDDSLKDRKENRIEGENVVSIGMLMETIEELMRAFWEFLRADKEEANVILKGIQATHVDLQDPSHYELLVDLKTSLQKKEKRLKEILRSGNCIVKKFQKHQESRMEGALLLAQVELKLVSRVLNMSRLTADQLAWCQKKLSKITFLNRKIRVDPSFLLFPF